MKISDSKKKIILIAIRHLKQVFKSSEPHLLEPGDLNDFVRDFNLSKKQAEIFSVKLKVWNLFRQDTEMYFFRNRQNKFKDFFSQENYLEFCNNVCFIMEALGHLAFYLSTQKFSLKDMLIRKKK